MRLKARAACDLRTIFEAAYAARDSRDPLLAEMWADTLRTAFETTAWHEKPADGEPWRWHAHSLAACPRQQVLKRAGHDTDGTRLESRFTFDLGHFYEALIAFGIQLVDGYTFLGWQKGGHHDSLPLSALADILYRWDESGETMILECKTESSFAAKHRREEMWELPSGGSSSARAEHVLQMTAQSMVLEANGWPRINYGWAAYVEKEKGDVDEQPVEITDALRERVAQNVGLLEAAWANYAVIDGRLPSRLPNEIKLDKRSKPPREYVTGAWQCRPRSDSDNRGLYCPCRSHCFSLEA